MNDAVTDLCLDQRRRWQEGECLLVEDYLQRVPGLRDDIEAVLDLIYNEIVLREKRGDRPLLEDYVQRFPQHHTQLRHQFHIHRAIEDALLSKTKVGNFDGPKETEAKTRPQIPGYEILEEIGRGGMGVVYRARQLSLNRQVALKMLNTGVYAGPRERERFKTEAEAVARLQHPNIVQIFEIAAHEGLPFLSLELVAGPSLDQALQDGPAPFRCAADMVETLARAMDHVHRRGIVHRDLKPANILLASVAHDPLAGAKDIHGRPTRIMEDGIPKITDFGLAKLYDGPHSKMTKAPIGTPHYMAPEQAMGHGEQINALSDVYGLGTILYELLTAQPPFQGNSVLEVLYNVRTQEPKSPAKLRPGLPRDLETICLKCLHKKPGQRYASALDLAEDLRRFLAHEPIRARPTGLWERAFKWTRRRPALAGVTAVAVVTLAVLLLLVLQHRQDLDDTRASERQKQFKHLQQSREQLQAFTRHRSDAAFNWISSTLSASQDRTSQAASTKESARNALAAIGIDADALAPPVVSPYWSEAEKAEVRAGCYQLFLILADAEGRQNTRQALAILDRTARVFQPTQALHLRRAHFLRQMKDDLGARSAQETALALRPESVLDFFLLGDWLYQQRKVEEAAETFQRALQVEPADFWSQYYLAVCQLDLQRPADARAALTKCLQSKPDYARALLLRGRAHAELDQVEAAEQDFSAALEVEQNRDARYVLHVSRGRLHIGSKRYDLARTDLTKAVALRPDLFHAHFNLAVLYQAQREFDKSNEALDKVIRLKPAKEIAAICHVERSRNLYSTKQFILALQAADAALQAWPKNAEGYLRRSFALVELKRCREAKQCFAAFLAHQGKPGPDFYSGRGHAQMQLGEFLAAKDDYTRALELDPRADLFVHRGWAYFFADAFQPALHDFKEAVRRDPDDADAYAGRGLTLVMLGEIAGGIADAEAALSRQPRTPEMMHNVACIFALSAAHPEKITAQQLRECHDRGVETIRKTLNMIPAPERSAFWRTKILPDPALDSLRDSAGFMKLCLQYSLGEAKE